MSNNVSIKGVDVIGLGYQIGVGKDTVAEYLRQKYAFKIMKFADALKEAVSIIFGWPREKLEDPEFKTVEDPFWGMTPRTALQLVGTEGMRQGVRNDVWVKALERRILDQDLSAVAISDMRFTNEVQAVKDWGGFTVKVFRPEKHKGGLTAGGIAKHASEVELDEYEDWDYQLFNVTTIEDLQRKIDVMMEALYP